VPPLSTLGHPLLASRASAPRDACPCLPQGPERGPQVLSLEASAEAGAQGSPIGAPSRLRCRLTRACPSMSRPCVTTTCIRKGVAPGAVRALQAGHGGRGPGAGVSPSPRGSKPCGSLPGAQELASLGHRRLCSPPAEAPPQAQERGGRRPLERRAGRGAGCGRREGEDLLLGNGERERGINRRDLLLARSLGVRGRGGSGQGRGRGRRGCGTGGLCHDQREGRQWGHEPSGGDRGDAEAKAEADERQRRVQGGCGRSLTHGQARSRFLAWEPFRATFPHGSTGALRWQPRPRLWELPKSVPW